MPSSSLSFCGSVVVPVLGVVPDGAIILFSGLGENAQPRLDIGVGALAGSTVMLICLPVTSLLFAGYLSMLIHRELMHPPPAIPLVSSFSQ